MYMYVCKRRVKFDSGRSFRRVIVLAAVCVVHRISVHYAVGTNTFPCGRDGKGVETGKPGSGLRWLLSLIGDV